jgi:hypothetical protein
MTEFIFPLHAPLNLHLRNENLRLIDNLKGRDRTISKERRQSANALYVSFMKRRSNVLSFTPVPSTSAKRLFLYFRGKLEDGTVFDSSHKRNKPFSFTLGVGQVIQGWDEGVIQMKVGEKALLQITSDYGYGSQGKWEVGSSSLSTLVFLQYFFYQMFQARVA